MFKNSPLANTSSIAPGDDEPLHMPFSTAHYLLEQSSNGILSPQVSQFLTKHVAQLKSPSNPFPRADKAKKELASGQLQLVGGGKAKVDKDEQIVALDVAARFDMDEAESLVALRTVHEGKQADKLTEDDWHSLTAYVFEERRAVIAIVQWLIRIQECGDPDDQARALATELLPSILTDNFTEILLDSFVARTQAPLPDPIRSSKEHSLFWTKELIREQKALLELVFLVFYFPLPADGPRLIQVLEVIAKTEWGQRQEMFGYFDKETQILVREIGDLLQIIAIEAFNLEAAMQQDYPIPAPGEKELDPKNVYHANNLRTINDRVEALVRLDGEKSSPVLLGWAFLLSRVTNSLVDRGVPEAYHDFATQALRVEVSSSSVSRTSAQPLFQLYAAHALAPSSALFPTLLSTLSSTLLVSPPLVSLSSEPNVIGYLSVIRGLVSSLPLLIRLSFLTSEQFASFTTVFASLFGNAASAELCAGFWRDNDGDEDGMEQPRSAQSAAEAEIVALVQSRFPVQFGGLVSIVRALCAGVAGSLGSVDAEESPEDDETALVARRCATSAFRYLAHLPSLTHIVPSAPSVTPLPYEIATYPEISYRATRPIPVSRNLTIPVGTTGRLVSPEGSKPVVVAWELEWSGWQLFGDVLESYASVRKTAASADVFGGEASTSALPIEWESDEEQEQDVIAVLDIFRITLRNDPSLGKSLVEHLESGSAKGPRHDFVEILFKILERALSVSRNIPTELVSSLLDLISALLPIYPGGCWTFLRGSTLLFPSTSTSAGWNQDASRHAILLSEKLAGSYPITLSLLSLVRALVLEEQVASCTVGPDFREIKQGVLVRALSWMRDEVWPAYSSWRFVDLAEKYEMANRMVSIYRLVLEDGELSPTTAQGEFNPIATVIIDSLLTRATVGQLVPLLSTIAAGPEPIITLRKAMRYADAQVSEDLVEGSLELVRKLLRIRRRISGSTSSLLEKLALSQTMPEGLSHSTMGGGAGGRGELLETLSRYIVASIDTKASIQATKVITLLCLGSSEWQPRPPSLIALLGGSEKAESLVTAILAIASDPLADENLQVAIWDLISAIVETQPGLAILLVTGRHYPFGADTAKLDKGKGKATSQEVVSAAEESARALAKTLAPSPFKPLPRTAVGVALETVGTWNDSWEAHPALLAAVMRFFDFTFQHLVDYGTALDDFRGRAEPWEQFVKIAFKSPGEGEPDDDEGTRIYCHRMMAKAHAVRILALDIQFAMTRPKPEGTSSAKALLKALASQAQLSSALHAAVETSCAPNLHAGIFDIVHESFPGVDVDALRLPPSAHPLDDSREYGSGYLYSLPVLRRKLDGFIAEHASMVQLDDLSDVIHQVSLLNLNFAMVDAQISNTRSWRQLLEIVLPLIRRDPAASATLLDVTPDLVAKQVADEERDSKIILAVQDERLSILLTLVEVLQGLSATKAKDKLVNLLDEVSRIFASPTLQPLESVARRTTHSFHLTLFRIAYFVFRKLNSFGSVGRDFFSAEQKSSLGQSTEIILRVMLMATRDIFVLARARKDRETEQDLSLAVSVVSQIVSSPFVPSPSVWLAHCQSVDLFRCAFEVFVYMEHLGDGRPLYAQHVLDLCLAMAASTPRAAELMALEGLMTALTNNALTASAEAGVIRVLSEEGGGRTAQHELWTSMLALVVSLISALGESTQFVEQEVTGFVRLYGAQIAAALSWDTETSLTLPGLEELSTALSLMHGLIHRSSVSASSTRKPTAGSPAAATAEVAGHFAEQALNLLQHIVYAILHPNHLANLIEPTSPEERAWIEKDTTAMDAGEDLSKKPVVAGVTLALVQLARVIVDSLLGYTKAFETLLREPSEWRVDRAIVMPTAAVSSSQKTSIGTFFDLASFCQDMLRAAAPAPSADAAPSPASALTPLPPYSAALMRQNASQILEGILVVSATQLALWMFTDAPSSASASAADVRRATATMRREITTELSGDLVSVLEKASGGKGGKEAVGVSGELLKVLKGFVQARLMVEE